MRQIKFILLLFSILVLNGCQSFFEDTTPIEVLQDYELEDLFKDDREKALERYQDKYIEVTGIVTYKFDNYDRFEIEMAHEVVCKLNDNEFFDTFGKGAKVTVVGKFVEEGINELVLENCVIKHVSYDINQDISIDQFYSGEYNLNRNELMKVTGKLIAITDPVYHSIILETTTGETVEFIFDSDYNFTHLTIGEMVTIRGFIVKDYYESDYKATVKYYHISVVAN